jgi:HAD superfamily hydrolase (TIGR01509 family)
MFDEFCTRVLGRKFAAVVFDCDGVLVDSEPLANRVMAELLGEHGVRLTTAECMKRFIGLTVEEEAAAIRAEFGVDLRDVLERELTPRTMRTFERELRGTPGAEAFVAGVRLPKAVASNSRPERVTLSLRAAGLDRFFGRHVYTAAAVARPKPSPEVYLLAAERLGVVAEECLVFEDSRSGTQAARAARMTVVGYMGGGHIGAGHGEKLVAAGAVRTIAAWPAA